MKPLTPDLFWLTLTILLTGLMWVPYILNRLKELGPWPALRNPRPDERPEADWAYRNERAHSNAVENLVVFAPLVLTIHVLEGNNELTAMVSGVFFFARLAHFIIYTMGVPLLRTIAFAVGGVCQVILALRLLGYV